MKKYQIIYADPPWKYDNSLESGGTAYFGAVVRYPVMSNEKLCSLNIKGITAKDAILFIWVTSPKLNEVLPIIESWGFNYKTVAFCWNKITTGGKWVHNMGHWTMGNIELCLLATKGHPKRISKTIKQLTIAPRTTHSKKPAIIREKIIKLVGNLPRIELFARKEDLLFDADGFEGWDIWGNEVESDINLLDK